MEYGFEIIDYEQEMNNYFRGVSGRHIKDTLFIRVRNTGTGGWSKFQGYFKCYENQSNYFFEEAHISEDVYPNGQLELVLNFPRIEKNKNNGDCICSIQLFYKDQGYNAQVIRFRKDYDLFGNNLAKEEKVEEEEEEEEVIYQIKEEEEKKEEIKEEIKEEKKEEKKEILQPNKIDKEIVKNNEEKKEDENQIIVKKFRSAFDFSPADFSDEYVLDIILKSKKDFQRAMMLHLALEDKKAAEKKNKSKTKAGLEQLVSEFRKAYQLSEQDYSNEKLREVLAKKEGNFENAFEELMSFIQ